MPVGGIAVLYIALRPLVDAVIGATLSWSELCIISGHLPSLITGTNVIMPSGDKARAALANCTDAVLICECE